MPISSSGSFTLSSTLRHSNSVGAWKTIPYSRPSRAACAALPLTSTLPRVGPIRSPMMRSSVLLPQPDGPMSETNSPRRMSRSIPASAVVTTAPPVRKVLSTSRMRTIASAPPSPAPPISPALAACAISSGVRKIGRSLTRAPPGRGRATSIARPAPRGRRTRSRAAPRPGSRPTASPGRRCTGC